jgi:predicted transcriptional regulator YheO
LCDHVVTEATDELSREDKITLIAKLDDKGVFQVKRAASILASQFGFSKATIYNYLREARGGLSQQNGERADSKRDIDEKA